MFSRVLARFPLISVLLAAAAAAGPRVPPRDYAEFRFNAGSALPAAPAVGKDGTVYLGTADGYVEAIRSDGVLLWSFTVEGAVAWSPLVDSADHIIVGTAARHLYSISAGGLIAWQTRPPAHLSTDLVLGPQSSFLFGATDGSLWAYSIHSTPLWHTESRGTLGISPASRGTRSVLVTNEGDVVLLSGAERRVRVHLPEPVRGAPVFREDGTLLVLSGNTLFSLDEKGVAAGVRANVTAFAVRGTSLWVVDTASVLEAVTAAGSVRVHADLPALPAAAPVPLGEGSACVALQSGDVAFVDAAGPPRLVSVSHSPLHAPVPDLPRSRVVVGAGNGDVVAVHFRE